MGDCDGVGVRSLEVNPFDEPDVQESRERVSAMLEEMSAKQMWPARTARVREKGIELYAEGEMRQHISTLNLSEALRTFLEACRAMAIWRSSRLRAADPRPKRRWAEYVNIWLNGGNPGSVELRTALSSIFRAGLQGWT